MPIERDRFIMAGRRVFHAVPPCRSGHMVAPGSFAWSPALALPAYQYYPAGVLTLGSSSYAANPNPGDVNPAWCSLGPKQLWQPPRQPSQVPASCISTALSPARPLHQIQVLEAPSAFAEHTPRMPAQPEWSMESLNAECARILQTLCHGEVTDTGGDANAVLCGLAAASERSVVRSCGRAVPECSHDAVRHGTAEGAYAAVHRAERGEPSPPLPALPQRPSSCVCAFPPVPHALAVSSQVRACDADVPSLQAHAAAPMGPCEPRSAERCAIMITGQLTRTRPIAPLHGADRTFAANADRRRAASARPALWHWLLGVLVVAARAVAEIASSALVATRGYGTTRPSAPRERYATTLNPPPVPPSHV